MIKTDVKPKRRWLRRVVITLTLLPLLILSLHLLLKSDLPRKGLEHILASEFKINASIDTLKLNWNGVTHLSGLKITQPDYPLPLITIQDLTLTHASLLHILLARDMTLKVITVSTPCLNLQQNKTGQWNLQAFAENLPASDTQSNKSSVISLPEMNVDHAEITLTESTGTTVNFENSTFKGHPQGNHTWAFSGNLGDSLQLTGNIHLDPTLAHSVTLKYTDLQNVINERVKVDLSHLAVEGYWQGHLEDTGLSGTLRLDKARTDTFSCHGEATIQAGLDQATATIKAMTLTLVKDPNHPITLESGQAHWSKKDNQIHLDQAEVTGFGGRLTAHMTLPLNNLLETQATVTLSALDMPQLSVLIPEIKGLSGKASGLLETRVCRPDEMALEPLKLTFALTLQDGFYKYAQIRSIQATAFAGPKRWLLDESNIALLNGSIRFWARSSQHAEERLTYINTDFNDIDLKQALQTFEVDTKKAVGKASGKGMFIVGDLSGMTGTLDITVKQADLLNTLIIGTLYNALSMNILNTTKPTGQGRAKLELDYHTVTLTEFEYFNRGLEIRGTGTASDITLGAKSPIDGYVMASTRPLKGIKLPGLSELDSLLASLQKGTATVTVQNTLEDPKVSVVPFAQIQSIIKKILWIQLNPASKRNERTKTP